MQKRYSPVTLDQLAHFRAEAVAKGITVPDGDSGIVVVRVPFGSVKIAFDYANSNLDLHILGEPWFVSDAKVWATLDPYFAAGQ